MQRSFAYIGLLFAGCAHDVPDHEVVLTTNCRGPTESAVFRFAETDFQTSCSGGLLSGTCYTTRAEGYPIEGELEVVSLVLTGTEEFGPSRYELTMVPPGKTEEEVRTAGFPAERFIWCGWYVDENLRPIEGARQDCAYSETSCWAEIEVVR